MAVGYRNLWWEIQLDSVLGFSPSAYLTYLATKFVFDEVKVDMPEKATSILVCNPCGDKQLMERLFDTYDVVTFTDGTSELEKNRMPSFVTAAGIY